MVSTNDVEAITVYTNAMDSVLADANNILYLCRDYRKEISLDVPPPSQRVCCPCPDHHEGSYAAAVTQSRRLEVQHEDGTRFSSTNKTCTVYVKGLSPSRAPNDASVSFMTNGVVNRTSSYTVLGVGFETPGAGVSLQEYEELSADFGCPVLVCTNQARAARLRIKTEVLLTNGVVRLALANATNRVEIWTTEWWDNNSNYHAPELLLRNGDVMQRHFTMREWRSLLQRYWRTTDLDVRIIAPDTGSVDISVEFVSTEGGHRIWDKAVQRLTVVPPLLLPDYNRDGTVDMKDALRWSSDRPAYFWYNDDSWQGDDAFRYGTGRFSLSAPNPLNNGSDGIVNGHNDYVNMLPLRLDVSMLQAAWGMSNIVCEFTTQPPGLVRFLPVRTKWDAIGQFAKSEQYLISGEPITNASFSVTSRHKGGEEIPYEIPAALLDLGAVRAGALACEFICRGSLELTLRVRKRENKKLLLESPVRVSICDVHRMYRWVNLMGECDPIVPDLPLDSKFNTRTGEPDWPDSEHGNANVVFAHGYNMHPEEAWGWSQALFKRLWWSGIDAGFTAVMWRGNNSQVWIPGKQTYATANYHNNVFNAFKTAGAFAREVNALWGERKYMVAHSLGNMLVSAARQYHGLEYEKYFMLNAAVPIEAYDPTGGVNDDSKFRMTPAEWRGYPDSYRSSHWHDLFEASDARSTLTWSNRFSNVDRTINFYSSRDEVIQNGDGGWKQPISREFAWYNQERAKGSRLVSMSPQAGWVFGNHYKVRYVKRYDHGRPVYAYRPYTLAELNASNVTTEDFKERPLFRDFASSQIYGAEGSEFVRNNDEFYWESLAYGIPAESLATGANVVPAWDSSEARPDGKNKKKKSDRNINMATECNPKGEDDEPLDWIHSYFIQQSLFDTKIFYKKIVDFTKAP